MQPITAVKLQPASCFRNGLVFQCGKNEPTVDWQQGRSHLELPSNQTSLGDQSADHVVT